MSGADAAAVASVCTFLGIAIQSVANQIGADRARKHELELMRLKMEAEEENENNRRPDEQ